MIHFIRCFSLGALTLALVACEVEAGGGAGAAGEPTTTGGEASETEVVVEREEPPPAPAAEVEPAVSGPIRCAGQEEITVEGPTIDNPDGPAVQASGQCTVVLTGCDLAGASYGVIASGDAQITLSDCRVRGADGAITASGNAVVRTPGTTLMGEVKTNGNAQVGPEAGASSKGKGAGKGKGKGKGKGR